MAAYGAEIAIIGVIVAAAAAGYSAYQESEATAAANEYNAAIARNQAISAQNAAEYNQAVVRNQQISDSNAAEFNAAEQRRIAVMESNAAEVNSADTRIAGDEAKAAAEIAERDRRLADRRTISAMVAKFSSAGVELTEGSPSDVLDESVREAEENALRIRYGGKLESDSLYREAGRVSTGGRLQYSARMGEAERIVYEAKLRASGRASEIELIGYDGRLKGAGYTAAAGLSTLQAANSRTAGYYRAGSSLLSGAASAGQVYNKAYGKSGA